MRRDNSNAAEPRRDVIKILSAQDHLEAELVRAGSSGQPFNVSSAPTIASATTHLHTFPVDVVVLHDPLPTPQDIELCRFREAIGLASLFIRTKRLTEDVPLVLDSLGGTGCLLPIDASPAVQAQLIRLAAQRGQIAGQLAERVREMEARTREIERARQRFRDIIESNTDAILVVDPDGLIRFANIAAAELFNARSDTLVGKPFGFPLIAGETTELDLFQSGLARIVEMRVVVSEWEGQRAYIASLRDITERKWAEEDARRLIREQAGRAAAESAARRFRFQAEVTTLLSLALDFPSTLSTLARLCVTEIADWAVIYVVDERGRVQRAEAAHRDGTKAELLRTLLDRPLPFDDAHPVLDVLRNRVPRLVKNVDSSSLESLERFESLAKDERHGELLRKLGIASYMLVPLVARDRELGAIGLVVSDPARAYTEEDLANANDLALRAALMVDNARLYYQAQAANQAKTNLLAVVSHDLRTPLNSIIGHAHLLELGNPDPLSKVASERVERIRLAATHLLYLIDQLLSFARLDAGREELHFRDVDANEIAAEVCAVVEPLALQQGLSFVLDEHTCPIPLRTDPDRLRQVLLNLVGNALKYTESGEVRLALRPAPEGGAQFDVSDTGMGIRAEHLDRIFEPFWQVDPNGKSADGGAGLGLSVVRKIIELIGGTVSVTSVVGDGSKFTVTVPALPDTAEEEPPPRLQP